MWNDRCRAPGRAAPADVGRRLTDRTPPLADTSVVSEQPSEREPDYRMSLAAERTYLAYLRTGLALLAAGVAVVGALPDAGALALRRGIGVALVALGGTVLALARPRWKAVDRAIRTGQRLPPARTTQVLGFVLAVLAIAAGVLVLVV